MASIRGNNVQLDERLIRAAPVTSRAHRTMQRSAESTEEHSTYPARVRPFILLVIGNKAIKQDDTLPAALLIQLLPNDRFVLRRAASGPPTPGEVKPGDVMNEVVLSTSRASRHVQSKMRPLVISVSRREVLTRQPKPRNILSERDNGAADASNEGVNDGTQ